ncbi:unnamed protein product, partial [Laminaria digitata]
HGAESDAEVVDNEDIGKAGGGMFFMRTADPIEDLQPDHGDARITVDNSNHSLISDDNETTSDSSYGASVGGRSPFEERGSYDTAVGEKEGVSDNRESDAEVVKDPTASITSDGHVTITTFAESDPEAVGDSGIPSPDDYQDTMSDHGAESDAEVVDNEDIGKAGGDMFFMRTADAIEGLQPDHGDAHITVDNSNNSLNSDDNETTSDSSYGASVGGRNPFKESGSYDTAVGEKEGLACEMPFCSVRETAEDKQKEEDYEDNPSHVHSVTNTGHRGCCPVVSRRTPENVPLSVVPPAKHSRRLFVLDRKNVEREGRAVHRGCRSGVLQQGNVPVVPPTTRSEGRGAVEGDARVAHVERPPLRAVHSGCCLGRLQQGNAPMVLV